MLIGLLARKREGHTGAPHPLMRRPQSFHMPLPGEEVPNFLFTNQDGKPVSAAAVSREGAAGHVYLHALPFPDFCPRMSSNFAEIYKQLGSNPSLAGRQSVEYQLRSRARYAQGSSELRLLGGPHARAALFRQWEFAVPKAAGFAKIADFFALTVKPEED